MELRFLADPDGEHEAISLWHAVPGGLFKKETSVAVPFEEWIARAPRETSAALGHVYQILEDGSLADDGERLVKAEVDRLLLHPQFVASLNEPEALALGLPPAARLSLNLQSLGVAHQDEFAVEMRWTKSNGLPARVTETGSRVLHDGKSWRIAEPLWTVRKLVTQLNDAKSLDDRQAGLAALRAAIGDEDREQIRPDGFIERMQLSFGVGFSLELNPAAAGFDFDPVLFSPERLKESEEGVVLDESADGLLPPRLQEEFAKRFRSSDGKRKAYLLGGGHILFLDPALQAALQVVRKAQDAGPAEKREFATNPQRKIREALAAAGYDRKRVSDLFVETQQFSERVLGIDVWRKPVLPWIKPKPNSWLPEAFGLRIGDPPDDTNIELQPESVQRALEAIGLAIERGDPVAKVDGTEIPATEQARRALTDLADISREASQPRADADSPPEAAQRYFLQVQDNLEDVAYAPIASVPSTVARELPSFPTSVRSTAKPHQQIGFEWLAHCWHSGMPGALLADDMGLGKTFQALSFLAWIREREEDRRPFLVVAPTGLLANWKAEIRQHLSGDALGRVVSAYGAEMGRHRERSGRDIDVGEAGLDSDAWSGAGVVLTTFETMRDYHLSFARQPFAAIIYDEVQKLKNPASQMTRAAKTLNARFQLAMTGTPVENRLQDLWSIYDVIHPGLLGSSKDFEKNFPATDHAKLRDLHSTLTARSGNRAPLLLRRMKDDCLEGLPSKTIHSLPTAMPAQQANAYEQVIRRAMVYKGTGRRGHMLEILHQLRGVSLHPENPTGADADYFSRSARLQALVATLDQIAQKGEKALVFCESLAMQALLAVELRRRFKLDHEVLRIHGGVAGESRQAAVDLFQSRGPGFDVMILSPKAGGVGLTLTAANHVIHLSRWWNPAVEDQATDRVFRIGQQRDVHVYLPQSVHPDPNVADSSFDLKLDALMRRKRDLSRGLLIPGEDEADTTALFDEIVNGASPDDSPAVISDKPSPTLSEFDQRKTENTDRGERRTLSVQSRPDTTPPQARKFTPRHVFEPRHTRDYSIFTVPLEGIHVTQLTLKDPYACSRPRNREMLINFMRLLNDAALKIDSVWCQTLDAESVDSWSESDVVQRDDIERKWGSAFAQRPTLRLTQLSKRVHRSFHARELIAKTSTGQEIIWDLDNGVDGVMLPDRRCVVNCFVSGSSLR